MPCNTCENPTVCTSRCQAYALELAACAASGQMTAQEINSHVEAGEMEAAKGDELCTGNRVSCLNPMCDAQACLATPLPTHPQQEKK